MKWQNMDTAPKDGRAILGYADEEMSTVRWAEVGDGGYWTLCLCGTFAENGEWWPEVWMPLPKAPIKKGEI